MSEEMAERITLLLRSVIRVMREAQAKNGFVPEHMFENADALLESLLDAIPQDPNPFFTRPSRGGERVTEQTREIQVIYMVTGEPQEIRDQAEKLQQTSPSNWKVQEVKEASYFLKT